MKQIYTTTLRLNLTDEDDRRAYEHLQRMDKKQYRSYSKAIVTAINDHFERQARLESDPYLETREREAQFVERIVTAVEASLDRTLPPYWREHAPQVTPITENKHQTEPAVVPEPDVDWDFLGG